MKMADAERDLAQRKAMKLKQKERKEAIDPENHVTWPVIIKPVGKSPAQESEESAEPSMSTIEFEPVDHPSLQH
jgi:hypothetical protein